MTGKIHDAFAAIEASEELKSSTVKFLQNERERRHSYKKYSVYRAVLAAVCVLFVLSGGMSVYAMVQTPVSYISIDVNPSVELALNRFDRVISVTPYNEDGKLVLDGVAVQGKRYTEAIDTIVEAEAMRAYLSQNAALTFTVASKSTNKESELVTEIKSCADCMQHRGRCTNADMRTVDAAHENGLSLGKYTAYLELAQYDDSITVEDCKHMSMASIHSQIREHQGDGEHHRNQTNANNKTTGMGHGKHKRTHHQA